VKATSVLVAVAVAAAVNMPTAQADPGDGIALNGRFTAFSDGQWAQTNESYHDEKSVTQTWTITTTCPTYQDCTGRVVSDLGWSADLLYTSGSWRVRHTLDNWEPCQDGTVMQGEQTFTFWKGYPDAFPMKGADTTLGPSGGCGYNRPLNIRLRFTLTPA
jgi:hypothetical protein